MSNRKTQPATSLSGVDHKIELRAIDTLKPYKNNARTHSEEQVQALADAIDEWGFTIPLLITEQSVVVAGHGRLLAAKRLGMEGVPCIVARGWSEEQIRAYCLADNRLAEMARWDDSLLKLELGALDAADFDLTLIGFDSTTARNDEVEEWKGMPEFSQEDEMPWRTIKVHFANQADLDAFAALVKRAFTDKTQFMWFPDVARTSVEGTRYASSAGMKYGDALPADFDVPAAFKWVLGKDLSEKNPFERVVIRAGDRVMDCGGCIGTFTAAVLEQGAAHVRCYEPLPKNLEVLERNVARYVHAGRADVVQAALVPDSALRVKLNGTGFPGNHSIVERKQSKGKEVEVAARCFRTALLEYRPDVLKLDIEGAEYALLETLEAGDLDGVNCIFIEFHPDAERDARVAYIKGFLLDEGFVVVNERLRAFTALRA
jgi:FkbM family methyltransferase